MLCQTPQPDHHQTNRFSLSLYSNTNRNDTSANPKRHTIAAAPQELEIFFTKQQHQQQSNTNSRTVSELAEAIEETIPPLPPIQGNNNEHRKLKTHWEVVERHFVNHLETLQAEIETCTKQKLQLTKARDELVQGVIQLQQITIDLTTKNEHLTRLIAEKENKVSAFMYQPLQDQHHHRYHQQQPTIGVTLVDEPLPPPTPPHLSTLAIPSPLTTTTTTNNNNNINPSSSLLPSSCSSSSSSSSSSASYSRRSSSLLKNKNGEKTKITKAAPTKTPNKSNDKTGTEAKKELGLFRQLSRRISSRRNINKNKETTAESTQNASPLTIEVIEEVIPSDKDTNLLHPAVVISTPNEAEKSQTSNKSRLLLRSNNSLLRKKKKQPMFGTDIVQQARSENAVVPHIVLKCVREVEFRGLKTEGIYRKSGSHSQVIELKEAFDHNKDPNLSKYDDINVITSLLKLYLREASTCLLSKEFILDTNSLSSKERLSTTYALLHNLPLEAYCTIKFIMQHLKRVHQHHSVNRMPAKNIAVVFGPTLMRFDSNGNDENQMNDMFKTVEFIIEQSHILFANF